MPAISGQISLAVVLFLFGYYTLWCLATVSYRLPDTHLHTLTRCLAGVTCDAFA